MKKVLQFAIALLAGIHLAGGPYALVQGIAWAKMLVSYSEDGGLIKGAADTFSGEKPCEMCRAIEEAKKKDEKKQPPGESESSVIAKLRLEALPIETISLKGRTWVDCPPVISVPPVLAPGIGNAAPLLQPPRLA